MTIAEFLSLYWRESIFYTLLGVSLIQIAPIKINPWSWLARWLGRAINSEVLLEVEKLNKKLDAHINAEERELANNSRQSILIFNDEILRNVKHSKEHFDEILQDVDEYEAYCAKNPDYPNNKAVMAIQNIKHVYEMCLEQHDFL